MRITMACFAALLAAPPLLADGRIASPSTTATPAETVNWTTGVSYTYDGSGNVRQIGNDRFVYDHAGRLVQAEINGITRVYTYDAFGNRTGCTHEPGTADVSDCQLGLSIDSASNRVEGVQYDSVGNVKNYYGHTYSYDALHMPIRDDRGSGLAREFVYTADDERLATHTLGSGWNWTVRDVSGKVLREFTSDESLGVFTWARDYVYRDGMLLASVHPSNGNPVIYHYHLDHLGTPRRVTDRSNRTVGFHDYLAFGPEVSGGLTEPSPAPLQYTGHERDKWGVEGADTLDYMHARYYSPTLGRFLSLDRAPADPKSPQTWNQYAYARNSPLRVIDPDGLWGRDIIVVPITIVMSTRDKDLQHRVQRSMAQAQSFFAHADIHFSVKRVTGSLTWQGTRIDGQVNGQEFGEFLKSTRGLVVIVGDTDNFVGVSGGTKNIGGPTVLGTDTKESTLSDEIAHALGNLAPGVEAVSNADPILGFFYLKAANALTDGVTDVQEVRVALGLGLQSTYQQMLRNVAERLICSPSTLETANIPCVD